MNHEQAILAKAQETQPERKVIDLPRRIIGGASPEELLSVEEHLFRLQVQLDMQRERELLYKVVLVLETVAALIFLREWALWFIS
jgi:hypothetical protein